MVHHHALPGWRYLYEYVSKQYVLEKKAPVESSIARSQDFLVCTCRSYYGPEDFKRESYGLRRFTTSHSARSAFVGSCWSPVHDGRLFLSLGDCVLGAIHAVAWSIECDKSADRPQPIWDRCCRTLSAGVMGYFDCPVTVECKHVASEWLQSADPLIQDFGARWLGSAWWKRKSLSRGLWSVQALAGIG